MEEGELPAELAHTPSSQTGATRLPSETSIDTSGVIYSSAIEWPADEESIPNLLTAGPSHSYHDPSSPSFCLRLLKERSPVLRKQHKVALLDGYPEIHIGRDIAPPNSDTPRIRLKEMEVSKLHATIYWDQGLSRWSIVDMGSKHGTFVQSVAAPSPAGLAAQVQDEKGVRLSAPRVASMPRIMQHQDRLSIGGTTFVVHIHEDRIPCSACSPQGADEIPLFLHRAADGDTASSQKRKLDSVVSASVATTAVPSHLRDPKKALATLKRSLLSSQAALPPPTTQNQTLQYVDRSARRRALHPDHSPAITPNASRSRVSSPSPSVSASMPSSAPPTPSAPLPTTNIGHRLLMKQGWKPGTALGEPSSDNSGLVVPLDPPSTVGRAGLGLPTRTASSIAVSPDAGQWRDTSKRRRWEEVRDSDIIL